MRLAAIPASAEDALLAGMKSIIYQFVALATRHLRVVSSKVSAKAAITGAALVAIAKAMEPENIDRLVAGLPAA